MKYKFTLQDIEDFLKQDFVKNVFKFKWEGLVITSSTKAERKAKLSDFGEDVVTLISKNKKGRICYQHVLINNTTFVISDKDSGIAMSFGKQWEEMLQIKQQQQQEQTERLLKMYEEHIRV